MAHPTNVEQDASGGGAAVDDNLFSGNGLDAMALAKKGAKLERSSSMEDEEEEIPSNHSSATDESLFSGDMHNLDAEGLAAQAAELDKLMASMEENLESNEHDLTQEEQQWSVAAKITDINDDDDDDNNNSNSDLIKIESIALKINETTAKLLQEDDDEEDFLKEVPKKDDPAGQPSTNNNPNNREVEESEVESSESEEEAINDDMSIDDSASESSDSLEDSLQQEDKSEQQPAGGLHMSTKSLSLAEITSLDDNNSFHDNDKGYSEAVLLKEGILGVDPNSGASICDWEKYRKWKSQQQNSSRSSQRWVSEHSCHSDSGLRMPKRPTRRCSDGDFSSDDDDDDDDGKSFHSATDDDDDDYDDHDDGRDYFDWKIWRQKQQASSTSRTQSFSISSGSSSASNVDDDNFDEDSVLAKLDEWEVMEESSRREESSSDNDTFKSSLTGDHDDENDDDLSANSLAEGDNDDIDKSTTEVLPLRAASDQDNIEEGGEQQWKDWQRQKRTSRLQGYNTLVIPDLDGSGHDQTDDDANSIGSSGQGTVCSAEEMPTTRPTKKPAARSLSDNALPSNPQRPRMSGIRPGPLHMRSPRQRLSLSLHHHQSPMRSPRRLSVHQSPMRSPLVKSPNHHGSEEWKAWQSWQREKRRTGILEKNMVARGAWNSLPLIEVDKDDTTEESDNDSEEADDNTGGGRGGQFQKSQSEKWDRKPSSKSGKSSDRRDSLKRANSLQLEDGAFDWKTWRKDKRRELKRSKSDRWASTPSTADSKPPSAPSTSKKMNSLRRSSSEKDVFDWKGYRKDRRKMLRKSKSERLANGDGS